MKSLVWSIFVRRKDKEMAFPIFDVKLAVGRVILLAVVLPLVSGNGCTGDGSVTDTCPEGQYCDTGECHNCSFCSVDALLGGRSLTKCLCVETSAKICDAMQDSGNQLIEDPAQLSFTNLTGHENIDLSHLKESYDRSIIDCTVPTTEGPSTRHVTSQTPSTPATTPKYSIVSSSTETDPAVCKCPDQNQARNGLIIMGVLFGIVFIYAVIVTIAIVIVGIKCHWKPEKKRGATRNTDDGSTEMGRLTRGSTDVGSEQVGLPENSGMQSR